MAYDQAGQERKLQLQELEELCLEAYENSRIYKQKVKQFHDRHILRMEFQVGQKMLLFNSCLKIITSKIHYSGRNHLLSLMFSLMFLILFSLRLVPGESRSNRSISAQKDPSRPSLSGHKHLEIWLWWDIKGKGLGNWGFRVSLKELLPRVRCGGQGTLVERRANFDGGVSDEIGEGRTSFLFFIEASVVRTTRLDVGLLGGVANSSFVGLTYPRELLVLRFEENMDKVKLARGRRPGQTRPSKMTSSRSK
ncbi:hypothetical protein CR513_17478, partial [Mucuna pruriens]